MNWLEKTSQKLDLEFRSELTGAHNRQVDMITGAYLNGKPIGYVEYSIFEGEIHINDMKVLPDYRRRGVMTALINKVKEDNPDSNPENINFGMTLPDGTDFVRSLQ